MECLLGYIGLSSKLVGEVTEKVYSAEVTSRSEIVATGGSATLTSNFDAGAKLIDGKNYQKLANVMWITIKPDGGFKAGDVLRFFVCSSDSSNTGVAVLNMHQSSVVKELAKSMAPNTAEVLEYSFTNNDATSIEFSRIGTCYLHGVELLRKTIKHSVPESGLYVDQLPDVSYNDIDKLTDPEETVESLWAEIEQRAVLKFRTFFVREVNKCHSVSDLQKCECLICSNKPILATALWYLLGAEAMYTRATSSRLNSYTALERTKAKEMRDYFQSHFEDELSVSVRSIDVHASGCFDDPHEPEEVDIIRVHTPII